MARNISFITRFFEILFALVVVGLCVAFLCGLMYFSLSMIVRLLSDVGDWRYFSSDGTSRKISGHRGVYTRPKAREKTLKERLDEIRLR